MTFETISSIVCKSFNHHWIVHVLKVAAAGENVQHLGGYFQNVCEGSMSAAALATDKPFTKPRRHGTKTTPVAELSRSTWPNLQESAKDWREEMSLLCLGDKSGGNRESVVFAGVSQVVSEVLDGTLAGSNGLDEEAKHGEHGKPAILDLLHLHKASQLLKA